MRKTVPHVASHGVNFSGLLWYLAAVTVGCLIWFFYMLYAALR
jgi:hypothetical protein